MTFKKHLAQLINSINNGIRLKQFLVTSQNFPYAISFLRCLLEQGFIHGYRLENTNILIYLKYYNGLSVLPGLKYVSKTSSRRYYRKSKLIPNGIYSTSAGINFGFKTRLGGELLAYVYPQN